MHRLFSRAADPLCYICLLESLNTFTDCLPPSPPWQFLPLSPLNSAIVLWFAQSASEEYEYQLTV